MARNVVVDQEEDTHHVPRTPDTAVDTLHNVAAGVIPLPEVTKRFVNTTYEECAQKEISVHTAMTCNSRAHHTILAQNGNRLSNRRGCPLRAIVRNRDLHLGLAAGAKENSREIRRRRKDRSLTPAAEKALVSVADRDALVETDARNMELGVTQLVF